VGKEKYTAQATRPLARRVEGISVPRREEKRAWGKTLERREGSVSRPDLIGELGARVEKERRGIARFGSLYKEKK